MSRNQKKCQAHGQLEILSEVDFVVVGGGSAGCLLANRLSEDPKNRVALIEAGSYDLRPSIHIPAGFIHLMTNASVNWMFSTCPQEGLGNRVINMPRGRVLGGTSAINGMLYVRGQAEDFDDWEKAGNTGWSFADVLPYFKRSVQSQLEAYEPDPAYQGQSGEMHVSPPRTTYNVLDRFISSAAHLGYERNPDYNGARQNGFAYFQLNQRQGLRHSSYRAFIAPVRNRSNLLVFSKTAVKNLCFAKDERTVTGVIVCHNSKRKIVKARREVILSAGAFGSPQLLELAGIGQENRLKSLGITPRINLPAVGENLTDHFLTRLTFELTSADSLNTLLRGFGFVREVAKFLLKRRGALTMPAGIVGGFVASKLASDNRPDIQFHVAHASFADPAKRIFDKFPALSVGPCQLRPHSRGSSHIVSSNSTIAPEIDPRYLSEEIDRFILLEGLKIARDIMAADPIKPIVKKEARPGKDILEDEELLDFARQTGNTVYHPVSTCRMGPADQAGHVVTPDLKVRGINRLRVADASIMPTIVSGNTHACTMMIAEKASHLILEKQH